MVTETLSPKQTKKILLLHGGGSTSEHILSCMEGSKLAENLAGFEFEAIDAPYLTKPESTDHIWIDLFSYEKGAEIPMSCMDATSEALLKKWSEGGFVGIIAHCMGGCVNSVFEKLDPKPQFFVWSSFNRFFEGLNLAPELHNKVTTYSVPTLAFYTQKEKVYEAHGNLEKPVGLNYNVGLKLLYNAESEVQTITAFIDKFST